MSTRGIIARATGTEGQFAGRYMHWDNYPTNRGEQLWAMLHGEFKSNVEKMLVYLIDKHPAGWSSLNPSSETGKPECYCHPKRKRQAEEGFLFTHETFAKGEDGGAEWLYAFDAENNKLFIRDIRHKEDLAPIDLAGPEPNWELLECGGPDENWRRCSHYAWKHFPELQGTCDLGTQTFLGRAPFRLSDAIGFIVNGKRVKATGSGGDADFLRCTSRHAGLPQLPPRTWIATVVHANGKRTDVPVAIRDSEGERPFPGVKWIFPPTLVNPNETVVC